jgi:GT2 family glycosyltransferase/glycosyltransferase involved in cell wall biosynthesis
MGNSELMQGNLAFRQKNYKAAIEHYMRAKASNPELAHLMSGNIELAQRRVGALPALEASRVASVDVVVPVYNALEDVKKCLASLQRNTDGFNVRIIVVNDGSEKDTSEWLREFCKGKPLFQLIEHAKNSGYTKAVNTGLKASSADYVVTQNSDTIVSKGWLTGLIRCMESAPSIGIVGPLSNAAGWQNVPYLHDETGAFAVNEIPNGYSVDEMADIVRVSSKRVYPRLPLVNGFCFMIKKAVINKIGFMDEENFPIGYGEESDYCLRAADAGFELAIADDVYVYHSKSKSFGHEKRVQLSQEGLSRLKIKHSSDKYFSKVALSRENKELVEIRGIYKNLIVADGDSKKLNKGEDTDIFSKIEISPKSLEISSLNDLSSLSFSEAMKIVEASGYFDKNWYLSEYSDVARNNKINPLNHFVRNGRRERRNPSSEFNTGFYLDKYSEMFSSDINPLVHFILIGKASGFKPKDERLELSTWWASSIKSKNDKPVNVYQAIRRMRKNNSPISIIVPVFNALEELKDCIDSVQKNTNQNYRLILINDCSSDAKVAPFLDSLIGIGNIEVYHNEVNRGFTFTVNRGIQIAGKSDVVLLNSDTCVTPNWMTNLKLAAYSQEKSATATPFSNNAGAYSAPILGKENFIPDSYSLNDWARAIGQTSKRVYAQAPTGHGFCMYIRRDCIDEIGGLDEMAFPKGYGEENDFCMRAISKGWKNIVDGSTYIYHVRSASFGAAKTELLKKGRAVIDQRYPNYTSAIRDFLKQEDMNFVRDNILETESILRKQRINIKPRALFVLATKTGGTPQTNQDLMQAIGSNFETFVLYSNAKKIDLLYFNNGVYQEVDSKLLTESIEVFPHRSEEYDEVVSQWMIEYSIELVHIRHIAWHSHGLVDVAKLLGLPVVFSFHDFYTVCPTVKLLDGDQKYCGGRCTKSEKSCSYDLWKGDGLPELKNSAIHDWKINNEIMLKKCDAFVTTSEYAKDVIIENYPFLNRRVFPVVPHGRDFSSYGSPKKSIEKNEKMRVLIPGNITQAKGGKIIGELASRSQELNIEIHILGKVASNVNTKNCVLHGEYNRDNFVDKVEKINPHVGGIFSIWPETHCHTLTELWAAGVPVIGFDIGAVGERIKKTGAGWLIKDFTSQAIESCISLIKKDEDYYLSVVNSVALWQNKDAIIEGCGSMAKEYLAIYKKYIDY